MNLQFLPVPRAWITSGPRLEVENGRQRDSRDCRPRRLARCHQAPRRRSRWRMSWRRARAGSGFCPQASGLLAATEVPAAAAAAALAVSAPPPRLGLPCEPAAAPPPPGAATRPLPAAPLAGTAAAAAAAATATPAAAVAAAGVPA